MSGHAPRCYRHEFPVLIREWRKQWGQGDFPFFFVQLVPVDESSDDPGYSTYKSLVREGQLLAMRDVPNTGMAVAIDVGDPGGPRPSHPPDKKSVGERLARRALNRVYGQTDLIPSGPVYKSHVVRGNEIVLQFDYVDGGLAARGEQSVLRGFTVAGEDGKWRWADARVEADTVVVSAPEVPHPVAVRYAWANIPICNLYNRAGLPAAAFRPDNE